MAKKQKSGLTSIPVTITIEPYMVEERIEQSINTQVEQAIEATVSDAVSKQVGALVDAISRERVSKEIDKVLAEGWPIVNSYGERSACGNRTLKDRIGEILNQKDQYSSNRRWLDEHVKSIVDGAIKKHFDADIKAARESFKAQMDGVLSTVVKKGLAEHLGLKL